MLKKILFSSSLLVALFTFPSKAQWTEFTIAGEEAEPKTVRAVCKGPLGNIVFASAAPADYEHYVTTLKSLPFPTGYPSPDKAAERFELQNLNRQKQGNAFHLYHVTLEKEDGNLPLGMLQLGRMPTLDYPEGPEDEPTAHHPIIQKWRELGITQEKEPGKGFAPANIERIENRGLAFLLPLFAPDLDEVLMRATLGLGYDLIAELTSRGYLLPIEETVPHAVISLLQLEDPNLLRFIANTFTADPNPGFGWFYPTTEEIVGEDGQTAKRRVLQPRVMVHRYLPQLPPSSGQEAAAASPPKAEAE